MTTIKAVSIRAFELFAADGTSLGLFKVADRWEGMCKLESVRDPKEVVIVDAPDPMMEVMSNVFGEHRLELDVFKGSPDLLLKVMA